MIQDTEDTEIPFQPRWPRTKAFAQKFLLDCGIDHLPVDPFVLYKQNGWILDNYNATKKSKIIDPLKIQERNIDAVTYLHRGFFITSYNDDFLDVRIRWTLAHEIGHIVLGHFNYDETFLLRGGLDEQKYSVLELEANAFAAELLAPTFILYNLGICSVEGIQEICFLSREASERRFSNLSRFSYKQEQHFIQKQKFECQFAPYLKRIVICSRTSSLAVGILYTKIEKYPKVKTMPNKQLYSKTDENNRFTECPKCGNRQFSEHARYCKLCGLYLYNECSRQEQEDYQYSSECGQRNPGDARYCEYCGAETLLMAQGLLLTWQEVIEREKEIAAALEPGDPPY